MAFPTNYIKPNVLIKQFIKMHLHVSNIFYTMQWLNILLIIYLWLTLYFIILENPQNLCHNLIVSFPLFITFQIIQGLILYFSNHHQVYADQQIKKFFSSRSAMLYLEKKKICLFNDWLPQSYNINVIENMWSILKTCVFQFNITSSDDLWNASSIMLPSRHGTIFP